MITAEQIEQSLQGVVRDPLRADLPGLARWLAKVLTSLLSSGPPADGQWVLPREEPGVAAVLESLAGKKVDLAGDAVLDFGQYNHFHGPVTISGTVAREIKNFKIIILPPLPDKRPELFVRVGASGETRSKLVNRFLDLDLRGQVFLPDELVEVYRAALEESSVILVRGMHGAGKTTNTLAAARRLLHPVSGLPWCVYYLQMYDGLTTEQLARDVSGGGSQPSLFVIDDCHVDFAVVERLVERLTPELSDRRHPVALVLLMRHVPHDEETLDEYELVEELTARSAVVSLSVDARLSRQVTECLRPDFEGLTEVRNKRLFHLSGGDLYLLSELLAMTDLLGTPEDIDSLEQAEISGTSAAATSAGTRCICPR